MRRSPGAILLYAVVTAVLVGATTAFVTMNKTVTLTVDGKSKRIHTFASSVHEVLANSGVEVGRRDIVAPDPGAVLDQGDRVVVRHARKLRLTVDGKTRTYWVTATTVQEALQQLHMDAEHAVLSVSRSRRLPLSGFSLKVRYPHRVSLVLGGTRLRTTTTAPTIRGVLDQAGIKLGPHDRVSADLDSKPHDGQVIKIRLLAGEPQVKVENIPYDTVKHKSGDLFTGKTKVAQEGRPGLKKIVTGVVIEDGRKHREVIAHMVARKPRPKIVEVGTKAREVPDAADLNWSALAECESGGDPDAVNPAGPYYGLYQFSVSTWQSVGGEGEPTDWGADEQTYRAQLLYERSGAGQWPVCGSHLFD
ncbi:MAG: ubiquitin-like domain-containing protein [Streptosporangiaceae bacterium]